MARHKLRIEIEFDIEDEVALTAKSDLLETGLYTDDFAGFPSALAHEAIMSARPAWDAAGLRPVGVEVISVTKVP